MKARLRDDEIVIELAGLSRRASMRHRSIRAIDSHRFHQENIFIWTLQADRRQNTVSAVSSSETQVMASRPEDGDKAGTRHGRCEDLRLMKGRTLGRSRHRERLGNSKKYHGFPMVWDTGGVWCGWDLVPKKCGGIWKHEVGR